MHKVTKSAVELRLAPSRFGELPTLVPVFNSKCWPQIKNKRIKAFEAKIKEMNNINRFCIHIHVYYHEELEVILKELEESLDIINGIVITLPCNRAEIKDNVIELLNKHTKQASVKIIETENIGRNIKPLLIDAWEFISKFNYCLHLHTKRTKGPGKDYGLRWLKAICKCIATRQQILASQYFLEKDNEIGMILPAPFEGTSEHSLSWAGTGNLAYKMLISYLNEFNLDNISELKFYSRLLVFPVGGMMIFRVTALDKMHSWLSKNIEYLAIPEPLPIQTSLHAIERLFTLVMEESNYSWCIIDSNRGKTKYLNSKDYLINTKDDTIDLYTKVINSAILEGRPMIRQILQLESKLRFRGKIKFLFHRLWWKINYILG